MKVGFPAHIAKVETCVDRSVRIKINTPELKPEETSTLIHLGNHECYAVFADSEISETDIPPEKDRFNLHSKRTPSQRLRAALFVLHSHLNTKQDFDQFYRQEMERIIDGVKARFDE